MSSVVEREFRRPEAPLDFVRLEPESPRRGRVVGVSDAWQETQREVARVAPAETSVLVTGELGSGKEVVSRLIHQRSPRAAGPFVAIHCAALPPRRLEVELFGHESGALIGATAARPGRLEQAAGGTLFLDEVAELDPRLQAKLLRVLETREFERSGGSRVLTANVRVIATTSRDLTAAVGREEFSAELLELLSAVTIHVPALRERRDDVLPLAATFLEELGRTMGRPAAGISHDGRDWLLEHGWPGNVRELRNAIERGILLCDRGLITRAHLPAAAALQLDPR
jgi:DNA-binding NtrC family response regulator